MISKTKAPRPKRLEQTLNKYKANGLTKVLDFLDSKGRRSKRTAIAYSLAIGYLNKFIEQNYPSYNVETILEPVSNGKTDVYKLLNNFISYLQNDTINGSNLSASSIKVYVTGVKSYLSFYDIEITPTKFKNRVDMPTAYREYEEAIDANDIRNILQTPMPRRLKPYLLVLASGGMRAVEALAIRLCDINFKLNPTEIRIRKEFAKTKRERRIFISDEATRYLKQWIDWKYRDRHKEHNYLKNKIMNEEDLVFSSKSSTDPNGLYYKVLKEFQKVLPIAGLKERKEDGVYKRRKVTFHSFRRFVKTTMSNHADIGSDYSEWFLGHSASSYYTNKGKEEETRKAYKEKFMKVLTFLDFPAVDTLGKNYEAKLQESQQIINQQNEQIAQLKQRDIDNSEAIANIQLELKKEKEMVHELFGLYHLYLDKEKKVPLTQEQHKVLLKKGYIEPDYPIKLPSVEERNALLADSKQILVNQGISEEHAEYLMREHEIEKQKEKKGKEKKKKINR